MNLVTKIDFLPSHGQSYYSAECSGYGATYKVSGMERKSSPLRATLAAVTEGLEEILTKQGKGHKVFVAIENQRIAEALNEKRSLSQLTVFDADTELWTRYIEVRSKFALTFAMQGGRTIS
ncbi:hypothetical protein [Granulicella paludicola]|uniref:hypothetical protein n=1 Tax=Granulicella paludicola TaxID=474951 RepID=UPI0021DFFF0C|nr:hypothetical protein [Granulicella paludicola]